MRCRQPPLDSSGGGEARLFLGREMFSCQRAVRGRASLPDPDHHFGASYQAIEYEWSLWSSSSRRCSAPLLASAVVHLETEVNGTYLAGESERIYTPSGAATCRSAPQPWEREGGRRDQPLLVRPLAAFCEIAGCYAFYLWLRLARALGAARPAQPDPVRLLPTRAGPATLGCAYAAYGGILRRRRCSGWRSSARGRYGATVAKRRTKT